MKDTRGTYSSVTIKEEEDGQAEVESLTTTATPLVANKEAPREASPSSTACCCQPKWSSICSLRTLVLGAVVLQNTAYALVRRYSRGSLREKYSSSSVLLVMEIAKFLLSAVQIVVSDEQSDVPSGTAFSKYIFLIRHGLVMAVPAIIYLVMNFLGFIALTHIDAATFSIIAQMKVFSTAIFSVIVLGRRLAPRKWRALATLTLGVMLISHEAMPRTSSGGSTLIGDKAFVEYFFGLAACFGDVMLSGFVSIYFEKVLKSKTETYSVWDRNFQLAFWSILIYVPIMMYEHPKNPFYGWTPMAAVCAAVGGIGGVLVALSIKLADSIMKTIATTGAIVLTTALNAGFLDGPMSLTIISGGLVVLISVCNYNDQGDP
uniref:EamA domain-containing protein n=1 Tax=Calcidiscus leptoporus TaxID=127549 RepID=A0A7S0IMW4_9EUKA